MIESGSNQDDGLNILLRHLEVHPILSKLAPATRDEVARKLCDAAPFRDLADLKSQIGRFRIKGFKRCDRDALVASIQFSLTRRPFVAALGVAGLTALGLGSAGWAPQEPNAEQAAPAIRPLLAALQERALPVGQAVKQLVQSRQIDGNRDTNGRSTDHFCHALDMSNWLEAAAHLAASAPLRKEVATAVSATPFPTLINALRTLHGAWERLLATRGAWSDRYFVAYAFGKLPALSAAESEQPPHRDTESLMVIGPLFHVLEIVNQRFLASARTRWDAPVRVTQGHNLSYAHLATDLRNPELFSQHRKKVLVNWDAHADLGAPFENSRMPLDNPMATLLSANSWGERVVAASSMSIAGWIRAILFEGLLQGEHDEAELIWIVPPEASQTSNQYMPPYGAHEFLVGSWTNGGRGQGNPTERHSHSEIHVFSDQRSLRSIASADQLDEPKPCLLHIVAPDDVAQLENLLDGKQIALSIDVDFAGTREPGVLPRKGFLPHYPLTDGVQQQARHRALIEQASDFYSRWQQDIRSVTIASSPNFTVDEDRRKPLAKILSRIADEGLDESPSWIAGEWNRRPPPNITASRLPMALTTAGVGGIALAASLFGRDWQRLRRVRAELFG